MENDFLNIKIANIRKNIEELGEVFGPDRFKYIFSFLILDPAKYNAEAIFHDISPAFTSGDFNLLLQLYVGYYNKILEFEKFFRTTDLIVCCINDKRQPKRLRNKLVAGTYYRVNQITVGKRGKAAYVIEGINDKRGNTKLASNRFKIAKNVPN